MYKAAIFDMDGTVLDTLTDLMDAVNYVFEETGHQSGFTREEVAYFFGSGVLVMIQRALAYEAGWTLQDLIKIGTPGFEEIDEAPAVEVQRIYDLYRPYYAEHCGAKTLPYEGMVSVLRNLRAKGIRTAVVSNKPDEAVQNLCEKDFPGAFDFALGEMEGIPRKPAPDMITRALEALCVSPEEAVYIGDSEVDIETARNSNLSCISVTWGFRSEEFLQECGAECIVHTMGELEEFCVATDSLEG